MAQALILDDVDPFFLQLSSCLNPDMNEEELEVYLRSINSERPHLRIAAMVPTGVNRAFSLKQCWRDRYGAVSVSLMEPDGGRVQRHKENVKLVGIHVSEKHGVFCEAMNLRKPYEGSIGSLAGRMVRSGKKGHITSLSHTLAVPRSSGFDSMEIAWLGEELKDWVRAMDMNHRRWSGKEIY